MLNETRRTPWHHVLRWPVLALGWLSTAGCGAGYLLQAAHGQLQVLHKRRPLDRVIADPATAPGVRARLAIVSEARDFASHELGLPDNRSYRSYRDLQRPYVVWNVVAAPAFSVRPRQWCFPITGCIAYRGYFSEARAHAFAARLAGSGDDVLVAGVSAYSTLGHFADPVLNTMLREGDTELAGTLFHELAHQELYVRGDSAFNEAFAMTVEIEAVGRWLRARDRAADLAEYLQRRAQQQQVVARLAAGRARLAALYASALDPAAMRARKADMLAQIGQDVLAFERGEQIRTGYDAWIGAGLNNAHLASVATYFDCVPAFQRLLAAQQGDLRAFYRAARALARDPKRRRAICASSPG